MDAGKLREAIGRRQPLFVDNCNCESCADYRTIVEAAKAHLSTLPKTKMVEVWHVEFAFKPNDTWQAAINACSNEGAANLRADELRNSKLGDTPVYTCIRVTGPHKQTVPA